MALSSKDDSIARAVTADDETGGQNRNLIARFLSEHFEEYRTLSVLREQGWKNPAGDAHFRKQRQVADNAKGKSGTAKVFYDLMRRIGKEIDEETGGAMRVPSLAGAPRVLDFCAAPGGFLVTILERSQACEVIAFSLPCEHAGHDLLLLDHHLVRDNPNFTARLLDITMLAADMGVDDVPSDHPDADRFLKQTFAPDMTYNLVVCDGMVLRDHERASYRDHCEPRRLITTQLALGLEHLKPGGTMIILLHKVEMWHTIQCIRTFASFSTIKLFKPKTSHVTRSSFYLIATEIQSQSNASLRAIQQWKDAWRLATFGTQDELYTAIRPSDDEVMEMLASFGKTLGELGGPVWKTQAEALKRAKWMKTTPSQ